MKFHCSSFISKLLGLDASGSPVPYCKMKNEDGFPFHAVVSSTTSSVAVAETTAFFFASFFPFFPFFGASSRASKSGNYSTVFTTCPVGINSLVAPPANSLANASSAFVLAGASV